MTWLSLGRPQNAPFNPVELGAGSFFFSSRRRHTRSKRDWSSACALPIFSQAGVLLSKSYCQVRDLVLQGRLEGFQHGRSWFVLRRSVEAYLERQGERDTAGTAA